MKQPILEAIRTRRVYFDGGYGTSLLAMGLPPGTAPEQWNLDQPDTILHLHQGYLEAGSRILKTNTFGANPLKGGEYREWIAAGVRIARKAAEPYPDAYVALDIGPIGQLLRPYGSIPFEDAVRAFSEAVALGSSLGVDCVLIETMTDSLETKAAVLGAKEACDLPVFVTNAYDSTGKLMSGATPEMMAALLEGLGCDAIGMNCSFGPDQLLPIARRMLACASVPVIVNPNAGLPEMVNGKAVYHLGCDTFAQYCAEMAEEGVSVLGGCCGTTPDYLRALISRTADIPLPASFPESVPAVSSFSRSVSFGRKPVLIGERINPTGKPRLRQALRDHDLDYVVGEGIRQSETPVDILDVNVGVPGISEEETLTEVTEKLQTVTPLPLQLDSSDPAALASALRVYNGIPLINSVNGKQQSMDPVLPLVAKYGGCVIALTLDEAGIPDSAEARLAIAEKIAANAEKWGIRKNRILVDPLAMAVSADPRAAAVTLQSLRLLSGHGFLTSLGVSNVSFGLPDRNLLNSRFFSEALACGLSCAILNPFSEEMMGSYRAHCALFGLDPGFSDYIPYAQASESLRNAKEPLSTSSGIGKASVAVASLYDAVLHGMPNQAVQFARDLLVDHDPKEILSDQVIPALNRVGEQFERKEIFLPQLLSAAGSATEAVLVLKEAMKRKSQATGKGRPVILATVRGDIHDIGKNIVSMLLESYGFTVIDLGKDVPPEAIVSAVRESGCRLVGLSALMTTTVPAMKETIELLGKETPRVSVIVGGAVLTADYAAEIGADWYASDATETVRFAKLYYDSLERSTT